MGTSQRYCLRWNNHRSNLLTVFDELLQNEAFTDVTLAVDGGASVKCHKMVLAACSSYFQTLFIDLPCKHPIVVLKDVKHSEIKAILEYMYRGEVNVAQDQLSGLLKVAEVLKVKGLVEENGSHFKEEKVETSSSPPPAITTSTTSSAVHSSGHISPPHSTGSVYLYGKSPVDRSQIQGQGRISSMSMCPFPGLPLPQHSPAEQQMSAQSQHPSGFSATYNDLEASSMKQKFSSMLMSRDTPILRTVLGQNHVDSSQAPGFLHPDCQDLRASSNGSASDERRSSIGPQYGETAQSSYTDAPMMDDDEKLQSSPQSYTGESKGAAAAAGGYTSTQKPEWKRYKQYTREDMASAINAVKSGMSALQAARKFGVPPRTLYDKVKKMGITTSRPFKRGSNGSSASFPYGIGGNVNGSIYGGTLYESDNESNTHIESSGPTLDANYKWRAVSAERESIDISRCDPNTVVHSITKHHPCNDDQVEDLSMNRKSDVRVIIPPSNISIKEEEEPCATDNTNSN